MDKETAKQILQSFAKAMCSVFHDLTEQELVPQGVEKAESLILKVSGAVVVLGFNGAFSGRVLISMPKEMASFIHERLMDEKPDDEDLLLTISEFGNMVSGNAITAVNNSFKGANVRLSPPSSFVGDNLTFFNFKMSAFSMVFKAQNGTLRINVALKEEEREQNQ